MSDGEKENNCTRRALRSSWHAPSSSDEQCMLAMGAGNDEKQSARQTGLSNAPSKSVRGTIVRSEQREKESSLSEEMSEKYHPVCGVERDSSRTANVRGGQ